MKMHDLLNKTLKALKSNSPEILTAFGVSGVVSTAYLTAKASFKSANDLQMAPRDMEFKEKAKIVWKNYIPAGISGALTVTCIITSSRVTGKRTAAAVTAYSLTERAFSEYREKVVEQIGKGKEQKIRDDIAQDRVSNNPSGSKEVIIGGKGHILCCELYTHRYFRSDMESLRRAQNDINMKIISSLYVSLEDLYDLIGLPYTSTSANLGWDSDKLMELQFSTVLNEDGEPCLAFDYNYVKPFK